MEKRDSRIEVLDLYCVASSWATQMWAVSLMINVKSHPCKMSYFNINVASELIWQLYIFTLSGSQNDTERARFILKSHLNIWPVYWFILISKLSWPPPSQIFMLLTYYWFGSLSFRCVSMDSFQTLSCGFKLHTAPLSPFFPRLAEIPPDSLFCPAIGWSALLTRQRISGKECSHKPETGNSQPKHDNAMSWLKLDMGAEKPAVT